MPEHCTNLAEWQVLAAKQGHLRALLLPVLPQPYRGNDVRLASVRDAGLSVAPGQTWVEVWPCGHVNRLPNCPLGAPGDIILGRECFAAIWPDEHPDGWTVDDDGTERGLRISECRIEYRADGDWHRLPGEWPEESRDDDERPRWLPATHLPRGFSRWRFTNAGVTVVRLADVSEGDALACGAERWTADGVLPVAQLQAAWQARYKLPWDVAWAWLVRLEPEVPDDHRGA